MLNYGYVLPKLTYKSLCHYLVKISMDISVCHSEDYKNYDHFLGFVSVVTNPEGIQRKKKQPKF